MFLKFMRFISIFMLTGFALAFFTGRYTNLLPFFLYGGLFFLLFAVGYIIMHYVRRIRAMIKN
ncbi:hypothetical protein [Pseudalkalibacillus berkeleyi]|uniref:Uncharacterized protein n=1 Tax=Pseudalkalibacillus berkeleyi TaxID=1069813 RepID=A0ABS9GUP9_9BACL|nr:hypothetical protein [Pseudalkalibacillus berkeleyi]MCF6136557.1 hypothetical protein [Pseudalkalibacillus berkeleyi]